MKNMSPFKIVVTGFFGLFIFVGIIVFALSKASQSENSSTVTIWGGISNEAFEKLYNDSTIKKNKLITVNYVKKDQVDFDQEFIESLAEGRGPDIVLLREDSVYKHRNKLFTIPYKNYPERNFKDKFIEQGEMFLTPGGVLAVPLMVDPLVMYWNRDIFSNNLISQPPQYWDQIYPLIDKVTKKDNGNNILQSAIALGEWRNIVNAKEIFAMLLLQAGTPIAVRNGEKVESVLNFTFDKPVAPSQSAINFYTQFSNPTSNSYSWNRSLPTSLNMFLSGNLAIYIGFASEIFSIRQKNPNLNFDVSTVPQTRDTNKKSVFGHMYSFSISKQSKNTISALNIINSLTEATALKSLESITDLPPVRRDMLVDKPTDAFRSVFYSSALISRSWIDPDLVQSSEIFRDLIESITSGKNRIFEASTKANNELSALFR